MASLYSFKQTFLILTDYNISIFFFCIVLSKKFLPNPSYKDFSLLFSFNSFIVIVFTFKYKFHFVLAFLKFAFWGRNIYIQFFFYHLLAKKPTESLYIYKKSVAHVYVGLLLDSVI